MSPVEDLGGRLLNYLYDWMAHEANLAKEFATADQEENAHCPLCGFLATQAHINSMSVPRVARPQTKSYRPSTSTC